MNRRDWVEMMYGNTMDVVASTIRAGITVPPGKKLVVCDLSSIEARVLGWMSGCQRINNIFASGRDTYRDFASHWFGIPYEEVTKEQRRISKPPDLGCGYQLSGATLIEYAAGMGVDMTGKQAKEAVTLWRSLNHEVPTMWQWFVDACKHVIQYNSVATGYRVTISRDEQFLFIQLPSDRKIYYYQPLIEPRTIKTKDPETGETRTWQTHSVTYMGMNQHSHKWERISTHGGKITENIDQAIARDILALGIGKSEQEPLNEVVGHVHDEIITLCDEANAEEGLRRLEAYMAAPVEWAPGLMLGASGYIADRYRKE